MTTIAFKDGVMAADRQVTFGSMNDCEATKIAKAPNGDIAGVCGKLALAAEFLRWFAKNEGAGPRPSLLDDDKDNETWALVARTDGTLEIHDPRGWAKISAPFYALGSGADFAFAAMACGCGAADAVKIAARFDIKTGAAIDIVRLPESGDCNPVHG